MKFSLLLAAVGANAYVCTHPPYEAHVVASSPLVVYLAGFLTPAERSHLRAATRDSFARSAVADRGQAVAHGARTSQSTSVAPDAVVRCLQERALRFQGLLATQDDRTRLEPLQLVKYGRGERYHFHTDWFTDPRHATAAQGGNRASSFFAYVDGADADGPPDNATVRGGGTNFPLLDAPESPAWCAYIDCDEPWEHGVTFRPIAGNAVYWDNLLPGSDSGDPRTLHAGLPVVRGAKMGMNIWTRQGRVPASVRGE